MLMLFSKWNESHTRSSQTVSRLLINRSRRSARARVPHEVSGVCRRRPHRRIWQLCGSWRQTAPVLGSLMTGKVYLSSAVGDKSIAFIVTNIIELYPDSFMWKTFMA
ncbi:hypothetical protein BDR07DRAFT_305052 [Suillus spraguei]|nr:hypothetical protein BDR07DRAFT_305052 [Suillus spraguei]